MDLENPHVLSKHELRMLRRIPTSRDEFLLIKRKVQRIARAVARNRGTIIRIACPHCVTIEGAYKCSCCRYGKTFSKRNEFFLCTRMSFGGICASGIAFVALHQDCAETYDDEYMQDHLIQSACSRLEAIRWAQGHIEWANDGLKGQANGLNKRPKRVII